ncbi:hypothetical protein NYE25_28055 [Paenibacillus sp. FSL E2-8871]|uniref:Uncharacterized protein n=1 Tax=Paenibacillus odorifer TaxID=189426 RepID=A0ABX3HAI5_9BACL|nr:MULTISPECIES: hypothetical protein [Paenibacillus]KAA1177510.1 hypothetical protein PAENI_30365 [Paenibacillus sp. B2(2019)]OMD47468.1 hypothetical protein BSK51_25090 [Paenibacillus odorifer]
MRIVAKGQQFAGERNEVTIKRSFGTGSFAIVVLILGFLFNFKFQNDFMLSHYLFKLFNWNIYTNETEGYHIPFMAAIVFWLPAVIISKKYPNNFGTTFCYRVGGVMLVLSITVFAVYLFGTLV